MCPQIIRPIILHLYLHRGERHVDAGSDEAGVVGQQLHQLGRCRPLRRRLVPAGFEQRLSANVDQHDIMTEPLWEPIFGIRIEGEDVTPRPQSTLTIGS